MQKDLLILGNGFDLHNGLKSSFGDFFKSRKQQLDAIQKFASEVYQDTALPESQADNGNFESMVAHTIHKVRENITDWGYDNYKEYESMDKGDICFWDFYFKFTQMEQNDWNDVEGQLRDFFIKVDPDIGTSRFKYIQKYLDYISNLSMGGPGSGNDARVKDQPQLEDFLLYDHKTQALVFVLVNIFGFKNNQSLNSFLMSHLNKFEGLLRSYLANQVQENEKYKVSAEECMRFLTGNTECNVLNFNYTHAPITNAETERSIHGDLRGDTIIGIDADNVSAKEPFFNFTKTFRIMSLANGSSQPILPKNPQKIIFFGHSLSEPDYSYFQSIFDYYDIYASDVELEFYYSEYSGHDRSMAAQEQYERVGRLLDSYGKTIPNHGNNLLHKLLLENRVSFKLLK